MSDRIRWHEPGASTDATAWLGYAGTVNAPLFHILRPVPWTGAPHDDEWALMTPFPGSASRVHYAADEPGATDKLKAEAERWLEEYVSSLGASFPDNAPNARWEALKDWLSGRIASDRNIAEDFIDADPMTSSMHYALVAANRAAFGKMTDLEAGQ